MLLQVYPHALEANTRPLSGTYLTNALHRQATAGELCVYANFIVSLDGRISLPDTKDAMTFTVPKDLANARDWRLYQELAAQADIMLTSARYFRQWQQGNAQDLLPVGKGAAYQDLLSWRLEQGLQAQPDVLIFSRSLNIPLASLLPWKDRKLWVATTESACAAKASELESAGVEVLRLGQDSVDACLLRDALIARNYRSAYLIAGPEVFASCVDAGVVQRLFLTTRHVLLGGEHYHSVLEQGLQRHVSCQLQHLYLDQEGAQQFADYSLGYTD